LHGVDPAAGIWAYAVFHHDDIARLSTAKYGSAVTIEREGLQFGR
jgi:hypothetical protein